MEIKLESKLIRFVKTAFTFFLGNVLSKIVAFLLIPIYTGYLTPEQFGSYDLVITIISLIVPLIYLQVWDGVFRFAFDNKEKCEKQKVITNGLVIMVFSSIIYIFIEIIMNKFKPDIFNKWSLLYGIMLAMQYQYSVISRVYLNNIMFSVSGVINTLVTAILNIIMISKWGMGVNSLYIASIFGMIIQVCMIELFFKSIREIKFKHIDIKLLKQLVKFSIPLSISTISYWLLSGFTKVWISANLENSANGFYAIANKFSGLILLAVGVVQFAWNEMIYMDVNSKDNNKMYEKGIVFAFKITMLSSSLVIFLSKLIFPILADKQYHEAINIIPITIVGVVANSFASFSSTIFLANKKSSTIFITTILAVVTNVALCIIGKGKMDLLEILICLSTAFIILAISRIIALYRLYKIKLDISCLIAVIIFISSCFVYYLVNTNKQLLFSIASYSLICIALSINEIKSVVESVKSKVR